MRLGTIIAIGLAVFMVTLAWVTTERLSNESLAILLGVMAGVVATVPATALAVYLIGRGKRTSRVVYDANRADQPRRRRAVEPRYSLLDEQATGGPGYYTPPLQLSPGVEGVDATGYAPQPTFDPGHYDPNMAMMGGIPPMQHGYDPNQPYPQPPNADMGSTPMLGAAPRDFRVIGGDDAEFDD